MGFIRDSLPVSLVLVDLQGEYVGWDLFPVTSTSRCMGRSGQINIEKAAEGDLRQRPVCYFGDTVHCGVRTPSAASIPEHLICRH